MSQLIACKMLHGLVFGADSKAVDVDANGNLIELKVERRHGCRRIHVSGFETVRTGRELKLYR